MARRMVGQALAQKTLKDRFRLDAGRGLALFRDPSVPIKLKAMALSFGVGGYVLIQFLEIPVEWWLALIPVLGVELLLAWNGLEVVIIPAILACLFLSRWRPE